MPLPQERTYTIDDIYALPDDERAELIDGQIYYMAPPTRKHQRIVLQISRVISDYIDKINGPCEVDIAPFPVFLNENDENMSNRISALYATLRSSTTRDATAFLK